MVVLRAPGRAENRGKASKAYKEYAWWTEIQWERKARKPPISNAQYPISEFGILGRKRGGLAGSFLSFRGF
jgi:hypothetical protein